MDRLTHYRELIRGFLQEYADLMTRRPIPGQDVTCVFDEQRDQYLLLKYGWPHGKRIHYTTLHLHLNNGKIWIEEDWTEEGIAARLVEAGVPKEEIVLAFNSPEKRRYTDFAVT